MKYKDGEAVIRQGEGKATQLCLLTAGQVKMSVAVNQASGTPRSRGGGKNKGVAVVDVAIFNARGETTGETVLLEAHGKFCFTLVAFLSDSCCKTNIF